MSPALYTWIGGHLYPSAPVSEPDEPPIEDVVNNWQYRGNYFSWSSESEAKQIGEKLIQQQETNLEGEP